MSSVLDQPIEPIWPDLKIGSVNICSLACTLGISGPVTRLTAPWALKDPAYPTFLDISVRKAVARLALIRVS